MQSQDAAVGYRAGSARPADRLLAAATDLFGKYGIRAVGIDRILREADCAKASLYSTFGSKDALVVAYLTELDLADRSRFAHAVEGIAEPIAQALTFFDLAHTKGLRHDFPGCLYTSAASEFPGADSSAVGINAIRTAPAALTPPRGKCGSCTSRHLSGHVQSRTTRDHPELRVDRQSGLSMSRLPLITAELLGASHP
jgi:AcrR family transcriptional regulator